MTYEGKMMMTISINMRLVSNALYQHTLGAKPELIFVFHTCVQGSLETGKIMVWEIRKLV